jgi:hypothetical protein
MGELFSCVFQENGCDAAPPVYSQFFISNRPFFLENSIDGRVYGVKHLS